MATPLQNLLGLYALPRDVRVLAEGALVVAGSLGRSPCGGAGGQ